MMAIWNIFLLAVSPAYHCLPVANKDSCGGYSKHLDCELGSLEPLKEVSSTLPLLAQLLIHIPIIDEASDIGQLACKQVPQGFMFKGN